MRALSFALFSLFCVSGISFAAGSESNTVAADDGVPVIVGATYTIQSTVYDTERHLSVRLPDLHVTNSEQTFPVVYVIDGAPEQDFPHLAGMLQSVGLNYTLEPMILVGI